VLSAGGGGGTSASSLLAQTRLEILLVVYCTNCTVRIKKLIQKKRSESERFTDGDSHDISGVDPFWDLGVLWEIILEGPHTALHVLQYVKLLDQFI
jgi:hypothetical protein